jgi:PAS domain S-box-containing protein
MALKKNIKISEKESAEVKKLRKEIDALKKQLASKENDKFKTLSDLAFEGIAIHQNGKVVDVNKATCKTFGYKEKEILGKSILEFVHPDFHDLVKEKVKSQDTSPYQIIMFKKGKKEFWAEILSNQTVFEGLPARVTAIRDITLQKESENTVKEAERQLSVLVDNFPGVAYRCKLDKNLTMLYLSNGFLQLTGYNPQDLINNKRIAFNDIIYDEDKGNKKLKKAIDKRNHYELEYRIIAADKSIKWVWEKGQGVYNDKGKLMFLEGFIADINDKKQYELELNQSRKDYKSLIDNSPDGILILMNDIIEFANPGALKILEAKFAQVYHKPKDYFVIKEHQKTVTERFSKARRGDSLPFQEFKIRTCKGTIIDVESKPISIQYAEKDAILVVMHDVTAQKQLIREQMRAQVAEETNEKLQKEIVDRKRAEKILFNNQKFTRLLIESSIDMICASDKDGNIVEFNAAAQNKFGYELEEVIGKPVRMLYASGTESTHITQTELRAHGYYIGEIENVKKNGETFTSFLSASILKNEDGEIIGAMGVSRDVSEAKKAEQALRDSEERYSAVYNQAYIGIAKISLTGQFLQVNQQLCNILGYTEEELKQMVFVDITAPEDMKTTVQAWDKFLNDEIEKTTIEKKYLHKNGKVIYTNLTVSLVKDTKGMASHFLSVFQDITERRKAEKEQLAQTAKLNAVFESGSHLVWTADKDACLTSYNKNFKYFIKQQYGVEVFSGISLIKGSIVSSDEFNDFWIKKYNLTLGGMPQYFETKFMDSAQNTLWYEIYLNPIFDENKKVTEVSGIGHDITDKIKANEKIQQSLQEKEILLKEVHHRVKNNLQVISSILNLQSSYIKDQNTLNILKESQNRIKSMAFIHENLYQTKDFSSINFSEYIINLSQNLIHTYSNSSNEIKLFLDIEKIYLNLDLAIPSGLIINEIVSNAIKYAFAESREEENTISIYLHVEGEYLKLRIEDNGIGIPDHIDFRNTESLGLQLVVTLLEQLNGNINIDNNKGTKYTIIFKLNQIKTRI